MIRWQLLVGLGIVSGSSLMACSAGDGEEGQGTGAAAPPIAAEQFATTFARAQCKSFGACCLESNRTYTDSTCQSATASKWQLRFDRDAVRPTVYDPAAAGRCLKELEAQMICGDAYPASLIPDCLRIFAGTLADGEICTASVECKSGHCQSAEGTGTNTCQAEASYYFEVGKAGDSCLVTCRDVNSCGFGNFPSSVTQMHPGVCLRTDGLYCDDLSEGPRICKPLAAEGEHCSYSGCQAGTYCSPILENGTAVDHLCVARRPAGAACTDNKHCLSDHCEDFRFCAVNSVSEESCAESMP
jgi:hypothetical protein